MVNSPERPPTEESRLRDTTQAVQDYLKAIYKLQQQDRPVATTAIAERLELSSAAVSKMLKHLAALGLVEHNRYRGVELTDAGEKIALEVIRHHRLLELYLVEALGVPWDRVDAEADLLEHVLSEDLEERMATILGNPTRDPHGDPIPGLDLSLEDRARRSLADVPVGARARVLRVPDREPRLLRYLGEIGLVPEADVIVLRREPLGGPIHIQVGDPTAQRVIGSDVAESISVYQSDRR
jgi:DtxR family Mn-dependent transcriptional regulator